MGLPSATPLTISGHQLGPQIMATSQPARRLFAYDDAEIFDPKRLIARPFAPTRLWLKQHNIRCILIFDFTPAAQGRFNFKMENIGP